MAPGIWARHFGSYVKWYENGNLQIVEVLMMDIPGAKKCQTAYFNSDGALINSINSYFWPKCDQ
jgi:hypothetical protein